MQHVSSVSHLFSHRFPAHYRQKYVLTCRFCFVPNTFHKHLPLLFFLCSLTHAQLLRKPTFTPASFTPSTFCRNPLLHQPAFTRTRFTQTCFSTNHLLHQPALTLVYTHRLLHLLRKQTFHQLAFTQTTFCTGQLLQTSFSTNQRLHNPTVYKQTNYKTNRFLRKPPFTPTSFTQPLLWACRPKARGQAECPKAVKFVWLFTFSSDTKYHIPYSMMPVWPTKPISGWWWKKRKSLHAKVWKRTSPQNTLWLKSKKDLTPQTKISLLLIHIYIYTCMRIYPYDVPMSN